MSKLNILFLHVDQLNLKAIGAYGGEGAATPNIDRLIERGVAFSHSVCTVPCCMPSRSSWYTGLMSEEHGQLVNGVYPYTPGTDMDVSIPDLGTQVAGGGYDSVFIGKWHLSKDVEKSFQLQHHGHGCGEYGDAWDARAAEAFLANRQSDKPFFLNIGLLNPHDLCMWCWYPCGAGKYTLAEKMLDELPELPPNHRIGRQDWTKGAWKDPDWRFYLYSYFRAVEMVDEEIGRILDAVANSRFADNTVIIFSSDHGEGMTEHYFCGKGTSYDHCIVVPLVIVDPTVPKGRRDTTHAVSGIDVTATICDYAGVERLPNTRGLSLRPLVEGKNPTWRPYAASNTLSCRERVIRTPEMKLINDRMTGDYTMYDLAKDPWEMKNVAGDPAYAQALAQLKTYMEENESHYRYSPQFLRWTSKWKKWQENMPRTVTS